MSLSKSEKIPFVSGRGIAYILGGLVFLISGLIRGELISTICGSTLLIYALFSFILAIISLFYWRKKTLELSWKNKEYIHIFVPGERQRLVNSIFYLSEISYSIRYSVSQNDSETRSFILRIPFSKISTVFQIPVALRGLYYPSGHQLIVRDFTHFFSFSARKSRTDLQEPLTIFPFPENPDILAFPSSQVGRTRGKSTFRRSDDLFETRAYSPGDDPRKINWRVYAHTGELSIRQGDLLPPPATEFYLVLNTYNPGLISEYNRNLFEILINRASFIALQLINEQKTISFITLNSEGKMQQSRISALDPDVKTTILTLFSIPQLTNTEIPWKEVFSSLSHNSTLLFFTMPQPISIINSFTFTSNKISFFLGPLLPEAGKPSVLSVFQHLLFLGISQKPLFASPVFQKALLQNTASLKKRGVNVAKI